MKKNELKQIDHISDIARNFGLKELTTVEKLNGGLINDTYLIQTNSKRYIIQSLHKIFSFELLEDIDTVTKYLASKSVTTPKLIDTIKKDPGHREGSEIWRVFSYIPGICLEKIDTGQAAEAAAMVGKFHNALRDLNYKFKFKIPKFHDTGQIISRLKKVNNKNSASNKYKLLNKLTSEVTGEYEKVEKSISQLPDRIIHGDLKISNVRFEETGNKAICLIDLDTMGRNKIVYDIGDAVRSWCMVAKKGEVSFDLGLFKAIIKGYMSTAKFLTIPETLAIKDGIKTVTLELSARYITDAYEEKYFRLDEKKYTNLVEQNTLKAVNLINFYHEFKKKDGEIDKIISKYT
ncbi:MAG: phosphotransferase enzyme family protein [Thermodesulfobacteriota bacterium]